MAPLQEERPLQVISPRRSTDSLHPLVEEVVGRDDPRPTGGRDCEDTVTASVVLWQCFHTVIHSAQNISAAIVW